MRVNYQSGRTFLAAIVSAAILGGAALAAERPNIVFIISDDQDNEHLGFMGNPLVHTPTLDRLASAGAVFTCAHLPMSRCHPTLASFLSGRWPHQTGIYYNFGPTGLDPANSLPNLLKQAGYATYSEGKYWEGHLREMGFTYGKGKNEKYFVRETGQDDLFKFIDEFGGKQPLFVWWAPWLPHTPHNAPEKYERLFDKERIPVPDWFTGDKKAFREKEFKSFAMEAWLDDAVGDLVEKFRQKGIEKNTLFVFLIDNGWCNGLVSKGSPMEKGLRTPIFLTLPGSIPAGARYDHLVSTLDLFPTILDYAGVPAPKNIAGRSLRPTIEGKPDERRQTVYGAIYPAYVTKDDARPERDIYALYARTDQWKYILYLQDVEKSRNDKYYRIQAILTDYPTRKRGDEELYNLALDPHELSNLAARPEHREQLRQFKAQALDWWKKTGGQPLDVPQTENRK